MAQSMAQMQQLLNSMTPEQRAQLQALAESLLEDMDLRWQVDQLGAEPAAGVPATAVGAVSRASAATTRCSSAQMPGLLDTLGDLDDAREPAAHGHPARRARRGRPRPAPASCSATTPPGRSTGSRELAKMLEEAGLIEQREGRLELTPQGRSGRIGQQGARRPLPQAAEGPRRPPRGRAHRRRATSARTSTSPTSSATRSTSTSQETVKNAICAAGRGHAGAAHRPTTSRSSAPSMLTRSATVLMLDVSLSMPMRDNFLPGQEGRDGAARAHHHAVPARLLRARVASGASRAR